MIGWRCVWGDCMWVWRLASRSCDFGGKKRRPSGSWPTVWTPSSRLPLDNRSRLPKRLFKPLLLLPSQLLLSLCPCFPFSPRLPTFSGKERTRSRSLATNCLAGRSIYGYDRLQAGESFRSVKLSTSVNLMENRGRSGCCFRSM